MKKTVPAESGSAFIDAKIDQLGDWRGKTLAKVRELIQEADPEDCGRAQVGQGDIAGSSGLVSWRHRLHGRDLQERGQVDICQRRFGAGPGWVCSILRLEGNVRRAIDIHEGEKINEAAFKNLIRAAVAINLQSKSKPKTKAR